MDPELLGTAMLYVIAAAMLLMARIAWRRSSKESSRVRWSARAGALLLGTAAALLLYGLLR